MNQVVKQKIKTIFCTLKVNIAESAFDVSSIREQLKAQVPEEGSPDTGGDEEQAPDITGYGKYVERLQEQFVNFLLFMRGRQNK